MIPILIVIAVGVVILSVKGVIVVGFLVGCGAVAFHEWRKEKRAQRKEAKRLEHLQRETNAALALTVKEDPNAYRNALLLSRIDPTTGPLLLSDLYDDEAQDLKQKVFSSSFFLLPSPHLPSFFFHLLPSSPSLSEKTKTKQTKTKQNKTKQKRQSLQVRVYWLG
jgi:hypothetical protein